jgi:hypothetical protein
MNAKALLIPIAALALGATSAYAFNSSVLERAGLSQRQISAFEEARELGRDGDKDGARNILAQAGIDLKTMELVRKEMHTERIQMRSAIDSAVERDDYDAFRTAINESPLADIVTSKEDFALFKEAYTLRARGEYEAAKSIMDELGFEGRALPDHLFHHQFAGMKVKGE